MESRYIDWLQKKGIKLYEVGGIYWRLYQGALVPAPATPCFVELDLEEAKYLLKESKALFIRYASEPSETETEWWYVICDLYNRDKLPSKIRYKINHGLRNCDIRRIDVHWLAENGYECYTSAYSRYRHAKPVKEEIFRNNILKTADGPFEYWGVFVNKQLAGYSQCVIEKDQVSTNTTKFHPDYFKYHTSYALITTMIDYYVACKKMTIINGSRSIAHDTNYQDFLIKLGYRKQFCKLKIIYRPPLKIVLKTLFPFRKFLVQLPDTNIIHKLNALIYQEEIHRACNVATF